MPNFQEKRTKVVILNRSQNVYPLTRISEEDRRSRSVVGLSLMFQMKLILLGNRQIKSFKQNWSVKRKDLVLRIVFNCEYILSSNQCFKKNCFQKA